MSDKTKVITDPTPLEAKDLEAASKCFVLDLVMKQLTISESGYWVGALGLYQGEKCQAILNKTIETVRKALFPKGYQP